MITRHNNNDDDDDDDDEEELEEIVTQTSFHLSLNSFKIVAEKPLPISSSGA